MDRNTVFCSGVHCSISELTAFSILDLLSIYDTSVHFIKIVSIILLICSSLQILIPSILFIYESIKYYDNSFIVEKFSNSSLKTFIAISASSLKNLNENRDEFTKSMSIIKKSICFDGYCSFIRKERNN